MANTAGSPERNFPALLRRVPGVAAIMVALIIVFALLSPKFLTLSNLYNISLQSSVLLIIALPMTILIMTEGLDLSMGAVLALGTVVLALVLVATGSITLALAVAIFVGLCFGIFNGVLIAYAGIPPFVVTLGSLGMAQGLALVLSDGQSIVGISEAVQQLYSGTLLAVPIPIWIGAAIYAVFHILLYHTRFGNYIFAAGGNPEALKIAGVSYERLLVAAYTIAGATVGLASLLMTARMNSGHPTAALGMEFDAIAAVAVGGTSFERGNGWLLGTLLGVLTIGILRNGLNLLATPSSLQVASIGLLVIVALFVDNLSKSGRAA
jgi:ribose transport system permease protein